MPLRLEHLREQMCFHNKNDIIHICPFRSLIGTFSHRSFTFILEEMDRAIRSRETGRYIAITNTESIYHALYDIQHQRYIRNAAFSCCDGIGVVLAARMLGHRIPRLHGPDLMLECCRYGVHREWKHFFFGGKADIPERLSGNLTAKFPGLITAGTYSPPFRPLTKQEDDAIIEMINAHKPDILWVGLGLPKQERWIADHLNKIAVPWMIGVGAAFDFHAGNIKRAPLAYQRIGLEWLYRLAFEPRMFVRNITSLKLVGLAFKEAVSLDKRKCKARTKC